MGQARTTLDRATEAIFSGDLSAGERLYATDAIGVLPDGTELKGGHEIVGWVATFVRAFPDARYEPFAKTDAGNVAVDEGYLRGTHTGPLTTPSGAEIGPTGRRVAIRGCDVAEVRDGLIVSHRFYFDAADMLVQLGILPPM